MVEGQVARVIADAWYSVVIGFLDWLLSIIDAAWAPVAAAIPMAKVTGAMNFFYRLDAFFPVSDLVLVLGILGGLVAFFWTVKLAMYIAQLARG